jgi:hypothetical protein
LLLINGLLIASLWVIWPFQQRGYEVFHGKHYLIYTTPVIPEALTGDVIISIGLMLAGLVVVLVIHRLAVKVESAQA